MLKVSGTTIFSLNRASPLFSTILSRYSPALNSSLRPSTSVWMTQ